MNNNNHNGKEVHRGQTPDNIQREGRPKPVNRIKKKSKPAAQDITPPEPKKIPLNINKNPGNSQKNRHKGHVIKLEDKESRIHAVETPIRENTRSNTRPVSPSNNTRPFVSSSGGNKPTTDKDQTVKAVSENDRLFTNTGKWLLIVAAILFVAWAVMFFYYKIGGNSHMILALAVICAVVSLVGGRNK